jgi:hypothetical protein
MTEQGPGDGAQLMSLHLDILECIASHIRDPADLCSMLICCKGLHDVCKQPRFYAAWLMSATCSQFEPTIRCGHCSHLSRVLSHAPCSQELVSQILSKSNGQPPWILFCQTFSSAVVHWISSWVVQQNKSCNNCLISTDVNSQENIQGNNCSVPHNSESETGDRLQTHHPIPAGSDSVGDHVQQYEPSEDSILHMYSSKLSKRLEILFLSQRVCKFHSMLLLI